MVGVEVYQDRGYSERGRRVGWIPPSVQASPVWATLQHSHLEETGTEQGTVAWHCQGKSFASSALPCSARGVDKGGGGQAAWGWGEEVGAGR